MNNRGFLMENVWFSMKKAGMSQHAVFWNSHSGIFQAQTSLETLKDPQSDFGPGIFHCVCSKTLHAVTSALFSSKTPRFSLKTHVFFIENPRYLHQKTHALFIKKPPAFFIEPPRCFHQRPPLFSSKTIVF